MKSITLTESEIAFAKAHAEHLIKTKDYCKNWDVEKLLMGVKGEIAYGKHTNQPINTEVYLESGDGGVDFIDGTDVKTISWQGLEPQLKMKYIPKFTKKKKLVLATHDKTQPAVINLVGEISYDNFLSRCKLVKYGTQQWYAVTDAQLDIRY